MTIRFADLDPWVPGKISMIHSNIGDTLFLHCCNVDNISDE